MPAKKKAIKKVSSVRSSSVKRQLFAGTGVFGWMIIGLAIGGILVLLRYLLISFVLPANIYVIEPSLLVPGMGN